MVFCRNCGKQIADDAVYCQSCGHSVAGPVQATSGPRPEGSVKVSPLWWYLPIFFAVLGGAVSYLAARERNFKTARAMLMLGLVMSPVVYLLLAVFGTSTTVFLGGIALAITGLPALLLRRG